MNLSNQDVYFDIIAQNLHVKHNNVISPKLFPHLGTICLPGIELLSFLNSCTLLFGCASVVLVQTWQCNQFIQMGDSKTVKKQKDWGSLCVKWLYCPYNKHFQIWILIRKMRDFDQQIEGEIKRVNSIVDSGGFLSARSSRINIEKRYCGKKQM